MNISIIKARLASGYFYIIGWRTAVVREVGGNKVFT